MPKLDGDKRVVVLGDYFLTFFVAHCWTWERDEVGKPFLFPFSLSLSSLNFTTSFLKKMNL